MKNILNILALLLLSNFIFSDLVAQVGAKESISSMHDFQQAINICPVAVVFGIYSINYEYLFAAPHGLVGRVEYESIPKSYTDASIESDAMAFSLNYRYHISGEMKSVFLGAYTRYKVYNGSGKLESTAFDFDISEFTVGLNLGKRWVWENGFNLTFALGYGFSKDERDVNPTNRSIESTINEFEDSYDFFDPFYGELSVGYAF